jgi:ubiquinone/menaquinone biosynthesis C-methylase UbiE
MHVEGFEKYSSFKKKYLTLNREPFFELAANYILRGSKVVLDIGSGEGDFFVYLEKKGFEINNVYLLDGNQTTVDKNKGLTANSLFYLAPEKLPFEDHSVDFIHISHLVDNLMVADFYDFLLELNRVLKAGAFLVISTPLLWPNFYDDLSHVRPYNPYVFFKYFVQQGRHNRFDKIQDNYQIENLVYRYYEIPLDEGWSSIVPFIDSIIISWRRIVRKLGFKRLQKNGYTLILKKING